jgi:hypothetical protein
MGNVGSVQTNVLHVCRDCSNTRTAIAVRSAVVTRKYAHHSGAAAGSTDSPEPSLLAIALGNAQCARFQPFGHQEGRNPRWRRTRAVPRFDPTSPALAFVAPCTRGPICPFSCLHNNAPGTSRQRSCAAHANKGQDAVAAAVASRACQWREAFIHGPHIKRRSRLQARRHKWRVCLWSGFMT